MGGDGRPSERRQRDRARLLLLPITLTAALALIVFSCAPTAPASSFPNQAEVERGRQIYTSTCIACHGGATGGSMMDYPPRHNANGHTWHHPDCELEEVVRTGGGPMVEMMRQMMAPPGAPTMPAFRERLSDDEIAAVLAFIKTMWTEDERRFQAQVTKEAC